MVVAQPTVPGNVNAPVHFNPYYNDTILRNADGTNNSASIKLIEKANEGRDSSDRFTGKRGTLLNFLKMLERYSIKNSTGNIFLVLLINKEMYSISLNNMDKSLLKISFSFKIPPFGMYARIVQMLRISIKKLRFTYMNQKIENCCSHAVLNELQKKKHLYAKPNGEADGIILLKILITKYSSRTVSTSRDKIKNLGKIKPF